METAADGTYELTGLPEGSYTVTFEDFEGTFAREYYDDALDVADADPVDVATGQDVSGIDAELSAGGAHPGRRHRPLRARAS